MNEKTRQHHQQILFDLESMPSGKLDLDASVNCLGITFENDEKRRECFLDLLCKGLEELNAKLKGVPFTTIDDAISRLKSLEHWPVGDDEGINKLALNMVKAARIARRGNGDADLLTLYKDEIGFPHGKTEDILRLSDPPYYTACPNPFIEDFIKYYGKTYDPQSSNYHREPFAADVSEGKNDPIYNAHSYHTKVPHKAIMRYILHYTEPGDIVFDGFCGTGMTGVAAQLCGDRKTVESLGYMVDDQGVVYQQETEDNGKSAWKPFSKLGARYAVLNDLSPAATFIAYNYNTPVDVKAFEREAKRILREVEEECSWMYATLHQAETDKAEIWANKLKTCKTADEARKLIRAIPNLGQINYTVWSDVFICPECTKDVIFWESAVDKKAGKVHKEFLCPHCGALLTKRNMDRAWVTKYDNAIDKTIRQVKQVPVLINYSVGKKRYEKAPDIFDVALIDKIEQLDIPYWFPTDRMPEGEESRRNDDIGLTHVHHFYTKRNLWVLGALIAYVAEYSMEPIHAILRFLFEQWIIGFSLLNRYSPLHFSQNNRNLSGTLYVGSQISEVSPKYAFPEKIKRLIRVFGNYLPAYVTSISTNNSSHLKLQSDIIDYIFTDPPFGGNLMYSELNFLWEAWLRVFTNNKPEAIENKVQGKGLPEYQRLMTECFEEYHQVLKPGRWMTVEFHNSKNSVWNAIMEALQVVGFVVADIRTLDKQQGSFKQVTSASAVKQDLIISCYKPNEGLEERFKLEAGSEEGVWDFVRTHLRNLPVFISKGGKAEVIAERQNYLLYDRMVAFHVLRGVAVPLSAAEFYEGLAQRFPERDGMYFLPDQVVEYDKKRMKIKEVMQLELAVTDESSAIQWLKMNLAKKPQTFQELHPQFIKEIGGWQKHEKPLELLEILEQNFLRYDGKGSIPAQIVSWMKQSSDLRKTIQEELTRGSSREENGQLYTENQELIKRAKDRWYVPDPNKASDLEKLRERALLREFEEYKNSKQRRIRPVRLEAVRVGFKKAWQEHDYTTIIAVARKIPEKILLEDPKLLMWYDQARMRLGDDKT
ncbi:DNA methyltransferase [Acetomicrobium sp.]|uniref:DNA methyltransferase n=1 Tax=Acetomicrobium sp. TaxID=1872099 RepID=UPI002B257D8C|nr:DNA methyltransferase [Acetomicrobium sp.]